MMRNARREILYRHQECEKQVRKSPTTAVLSAMAVGYVLNRMPLRSIFMASFRLLSALTPPALFLFGAAKLYGFLKNREQAKQKSDTPGM